MKPRNTESGPISSPSVDATRPRVGAEPPTLHPDVAARLRMQIAAQRNFRRHALRALLRFSTLAIADLATFWLARAGYRLVIGSHLLGRALTESIVPVLPRGNLDGWQYGGALLLGLALSGSYGTGDSRRDPNRLLVGCTVAAALPLWPAIWLSGSSAALVQFSLTAVGVWLFILSERLVVDRFKAALVGGRASSARMLIIGSGDEVEGMRRRYDFGDGSDFRVVASLEPEALRSCDSSVDMGPLVALIRDARASAVLAGPEVTGEVLQRVIETGAAAGCHVLVVPDFFECLGIQPTVAWQNRLPVVDLVAPGLVAPQLVLKRAVDSVLGSVTLLFVSPILALIAIAVRIDSPGPVLYGQARLGLNGQLFLCYKFRSMRAGAHDELKRDDALYAEYLANNYKLPLSRDPRVSRVGRLLRRWSLDELPQLLNVVDGTMSLVGPRPIVPEEIAHYGRNAALFLSLKPGMTGMWAVSGRSDIGYPDRVDLELEYVRNWSVFRDFGILLRTLPAVLGKRGSS